MTRALTVVTMLVIAATAHADSPKLEQARRAIDEVRFDDAQRLLVGALAEGGNSPAAVREIYKLSASTAVVLGQREVGEQNYRRWLALDASASIGADVAPKLREPFEAAQAYIAAHGRLAATATRVSASDLDIVVTDPLAMAVSATIIGSRPVPLSTERRARLAPSGAGTVRVAVLDDHGNRLLELQTAAAPVAVQPATPAVRPAPPRPTDATFLSTTADSWAVLVDRRPSCATPCSLQLAARQFIALRATDGDEILEVGYLPAGSVVVTGRPRRLGRRVLGASFTVLSAAAIISGIAITAAGCPTEIGGLCTAGLITTAAGGLGIYGSILVIRSGAPSSTVVRGTPELTAAYGGRF